MEHRGERGFEVRARRGPDRAAALRARARADYGLDNKLMELASPETANSDRLRMVLEEICSDVVLAMLGSQSCLDSLESVVAAADSAPHLVEAAFAGMGVAALSGGS